MARSAARLDLNATQQRIFPVMDFTVCLLKAVNRHALAVMTRSTAKLVGGMGIVGEQDLASWMGFEGIGFFFKSRPVDGQVASLTAIDAGNRLVEPIAVELVQGYLLDFGNLVKGDRSDLKGIILHHPHPFIAFRRELGCL